MSGLEAIGVAASIIQVADLGTKLSVQLFSFYRRYKNANETIQLLSNEIALVSAILRELGDNLREKESSKLCSEEAFRTLRLVLTQCRDVLGQIQRVTDGTDQSGKNLFQQVTGKIRIALLEPSLDQLKVNLERLKSTMLLLLNVIMYAGQVRSNNVPILVQEQRELIQSLLDDRHVGNPPDEAAGSSRGLSISTIQPRRLGAHSRTDGTPREKQTLKDYLASKNQSPRRPTVSTTSSEPQSQAHRATERNEPPELKEYNILIQRMLDELESCRSKLEKTRHSRIKDGVLNIHSGEIMRFKSEYGPSIHIDHSLFAEQKSKTVLKPEVADSSLTPTSSREPSQSAKASAVYSYYDSDETEFAAAHISSYVYREREREIDYDPPARRHESDYERGYYELRDVYVNPCESDYDVVRRSDFDNDQYYYHRRRRESDERHSRQELRPSDFISLASRRCSDRDNDYSSDDSMIYIRKGTHANDEDHPNHKRHLAELALAGVGAAELIRSHRKRESEEASDGMSHAMETAGAGAIMAQRESASESDSVGLFSEPIRRRASGAGSRDGSPYHRDYELRMDRRMLERRDERKEMPTWRQQQEIERLERELEKSRKITVDDTNNHESSLPRGEKIQDEDEDEMSDELHRVKMSIGKSRPGQEQKVMWCSALKKPKKAKGEAAGGQEISRDRHDDTRDAVQGEEGKNDFNLNVTDTVRSTSPDPMHSGTDATTTPREDQTKPDTGPELNALDVWQARVTLQAWDTKPCMHPYRPRRGREWEDGPEESPSVGRGGDDAQEQTLSDLSLPANLEDLLAQWTTLDKQEIQRSQIEAY